MTSITNPWEMAYHQLGLLDIALVIFDQGARTTLLPQRNLDTGMVEEVANDVQAVGVLVLCEAKLARFVVGVDESGPTSQSHCASTAQDVFELKIIRNTLVQTSDKDGPPHFFHCWGHESPLGISLSSEITTSASRIGTQTHAIPVSLWSIDGLASWRTACAKTNDGSVEVDVCWHIRRRLECSGHGWCAARHGRGLSGHRRHARRRRHAWCSHDTWSTSCDFVSIRLFSSH